MKNILDSFTNSINLWVISVECIGPKLNKNGFEFEMVSLNLETVKWKNDRQIVI